MPYELELLRSIQKWGGHPSGKPWGEWPAGLIERMTTAGAVFDTVQTYQRMPDHKRAEWMQDNPARAEIILRLWGFYDDDNQDNN